MFLATGGQASGEPTIAPIVVFSSLVFIYLFLPLTLAGNFLLPRRARNAWLFAASMLFYAWGEAWYSAVILTSIAANWGLGLAIQATRADGRRGWWILAGGVTANLALLGIYKYANFVSDNLSAVAVAFGGQPFGLAPVHLPIGISFFTFQAISYLVDIHRGDVKAERSPIAFGMYKSLFPQLIAGPIVRYRDVAAEIPDRRVTTEDLAAGITRFVVGLGKKVLIANTVAASADHVFDLPAADLTTGLAWFGVACYSLQIYFDFSGYSNMAIGLGRMLGFHFPENFAHPYAAQSIRDFWRRWHISLSTFFRDYVYIPLGGNRLGAVRSALNLSLVFVLCGFWHGASWAFVVWGAFHGACLSAERLGLDRLVGRLPLPLRWAYTMLLVMIGWVFFRCETLSHAGAVLTAMAGCGATATDTIGSWQGAIDGQVVLTMVIGVVAALGLPVAVYDRSAARLRTAGSSWSEGGLQLARIAFVAVVLHASTVTLVSSGFNPFIYYRF